MHRRAFTLFELLAVIGIIVVLMAMLFPAFSLVKRQAMKTKCRALLMQVSAACSNYRNVNGVYPDSFTTVNGVNIYDQTFRPATDIKDVSTIDEGAWNTFSASFWEQIKTVDRDSFNTKAFNDAGKIVDPWGHALRYRPSKYYPFKDAYPKLIDKENPAPPMQDSFQLWSIGYDEKDDFGEPGSDDITAWQK